MSTTVVHIGEKELSLSNLEKVLYPEVGFTKGQVIDYYARIAKVLLPHLHDRPLTLKRYPNGVDHPYFYEKRSPGHRPRWVETFAVHPAGEPVIPYTLANDLPTLIWVANLASLELHTFLSKAPHPEQPTMVVFDLDPGAPAGVLECCEVALAVRELCAELGLETWVKSSGSKGLQVYVPLNSPATYEETKVFSRWVAERLERERPERVVSRQAKSIRPGKVLVDWSQNDEKKTTVCVYSLRAKERPTVSAPLAWDELRRALVRRDAGRLFFEASEAVARAERMGDLFAPVLELKQSLRGQFSRLELGHHGPQPPRRPARRPA